MYETTVKVEPEVATRNCQIKARPTAAHSREVAMKHMQIQNPERSLPYTDEWPAYATLLFPREHMRTRKEKGCPWKEITSKESKDSEAKR